MLQTAHKSVEIGKWITLRQAVIRLGELNNWWQAKVLTGQGENFLAYVLPKSKATAAFQLATEISRSNHDKVVGPGKYHLFRLPQKLEEDIFFGLKEELKDPYKIQKDDLLGSLTNLSGNISISPIQGPVLIGSHAELDNDSIYQAIARHYSEAFIKGYQTFPYLT